jgi:hypothetical protein
MKATENNIQTIREAIEARKERSAWSRGVQSYALGILADFDEWCIFNEDHGDSVPELNERTALNGASDWEQWSYGGQGLCYDAYIAERLCTPSELRKTKGGIYPPTGASSWLLVEARAARQAWRMIEEAVRVVEA